MATQSTIEGRNGSAFSSTPMGFKSNFKMAFCAEKEHVRAKVSGKEAWFHVKLGPLEMGGETYKKTFVLEIAYEASYNSHRASLGARSFGSMLCIDYAEAANKIANDFCNKRGLVANNLISSWPAFQAVVSAQPELMRSGQLQ